MADVVVMQTLHGRIWKQEKRSIEAKASKEIMPISFDGFAKVSCKSCLVRSLSSTGACCENPSKMFLDALKTGSNFPEEELSMLVDVRDFSR